MTTYSNKHILKIFYRDDLCFSSPFARSSSYLNLAQTHSPPPLLFPPCFLHYIKTINTSFLEIAIFSHTLKNTTVATTLDLPVLHPKNPSINFSS
jgi:hypothetical protein